MLYIFIICQICYTFPVALVRNRPWSTSNNIRDLNCFHSFVQDGNLRNEKSNINHIIYMITTHTGEHEGHLLLVEVVSV